MRTSHPLRAVSILLVAILAAATAAAEPVAQVSRVRSRHAAGQTFVTWAEVDPPTFPEPVSAALVRKARRELAEKQKIAYRVYRSDRPIASVEGMTPVGEASPLSGWNLDYYGGDDRPEHKAFRYVVEEGQPPLPPGSGVLVLNPARAGASFYAVTVSIDGKENKAIGPGNATQTAVRESVGQGVPVLQRVERPKQFMYVESPTLNYYVRWESPPNCAVAGKPFDYLVAVPAKPARPAAAGLHLHCWGGSLNGGYGWWYNAEKGHLLIASNQVPYDWWTGYHERYFAGQRDKQRWQEGVVRPYSQTRMLSFLDWAATRWDLDLKRAYVAGSSMGGSGAPMLAIRYPERIAWAVSWVGVHTPEKSPQFKGSYANVYGEPEWNVKFEDGTPVWDHFNDALYLRRRPEKEIGFITFSNGKNDGAIGWPQAVDFYRALQDTRRPHLFVWGQSGHGQRARMPVTLEERVLPIDLRTDQTLPAFTRCNLDDKPGSGSPADGDPAGQVNLYLLWETDDAVDRRDRWEMTVGLVARAPRDECTVDLTPRRCQQFKPRPGQRVRWTDTPAGKTEAIQSGEATADRWGLVTLEQVRVGKSKNRIRIVP